MDKEDKRELKRPFKMFGSKVPTHSFLSTVATEGVGLHFGQSAEDVILLRLFKKIKDNLRDGFYIDVGAFHPRKYSNTFVFHHFFGWNGINIDASKESIALFDRERPEDINLHVAIGTETSEATYWKFNYPARNTILEKNVQRQLLKGDAKIIGKETVLVRPLVDVLEEYLQNRKDIDLLNIDIEGLDLQVLKSNNWTLYRPRVILIEDYSIQTIGIENSETYRYLKDIGYRFFSHTFDTSIYVEKDCFAIVKNGSKSGINVQSNFLKDFPCKESDVYKRATKLMQAHPDWIKQVEKKDVEINRLERELNNQLERNNKINSKLNELDIRFTELNGLYEKLENKREQNRGLLEKLNEKETVLKEAKDKNQKKIRELKNIEKQYEAIIQSRTWRYTLPARKIKRLLMRFKGKKAFNINEVENKTVSNTDELKKAERHIQLIKFKLFNLGFHRRALAEMWKLVNGTDPLLKRLAARELSLWYANQRSLEGARQCLKLLPKAIEGEADPIRVRQLALLEVECHDVLGNTEEAKRVVNNALTKGKHADLFFSAANIESSIPEKLKWINKALDIYGIEGIFITTSKNRTVYDSLTTKHATLKYTGNLDGSPKVTVIIPVYNAELTVQTALESVLSQTWINLEVLVVDDCSTDKTVEVIRRYEKKDSRVRLITTKSNGGPYVARNLALSVATGDFVTVNDADDWSHPEKIERQVTHLINNPSVVGNTSQQARATEDLKFYRRGNYRILFSNMSSFMFRRKLVMEKIGYLDSVRFAADAEFIRRVKKVFGKNAVVDLPTGPLSFQRQSSKSLTGNSVFGFHGFFMGARKEYVESQAYFHEHGESLYYSFPQNPRPFPVPEPMWPVREVVGCSERRHFDVIIASDYRLGGISNTTNKDEIKIQKQLGHRTGLIQMNRYNYDPNKKVHKDIREIIDGEQVQMLVYGEKVSCDLLIVMDPQILQEWQQFIPDVETKNLSIIVNKLSMNGFHLKKYQQRLRDYFGKDGLWFPINNMTRKKLYDHYKKDLESITLSNENWPNHRI